MTPDPIYRRNAGLRRINRFTKGALAGGLALTGGLSVLAARSFSGSAATAQPTTQSTTATTTPSTSSGSSSSSSSSSSSGDQTFQAPSYSIRSSGGSGRVSSGGS